MRLHNDYLRITDEERGPVLADAPLFNTPFMWPPPERMWFVCQVVDLGETWAVLSSAVWMGTWEAMVEMPFDQVAARDRNSLCVTELRLARRSHIPDEEAVDMTYVARGAEYVPVLS